MINRQKILTLLASGTLALGAGAGVAQAKHGADDGGGHHHRHHAEPGDDHGHASKHGADDGAGHVRHGGNDDGPNHQ